ncbi:MAG: hypothetical protein ACRD1T_06615, partial [Acidimicrobiia bacterium]
HFGGAWFDFVGPGVSGKIEDFSWLIRSGVDVHIPAFDRLAFYLGLGAEYGETRSWLEAVSADDEGPRVFVTGGYVKAGAIGLALHRTHAYVEVVQSGYVAHASQSRLENNFNWLGRSFEGAAGIRVFLGSGRDR